MEAVNSILANTETRMQASLEALRKDMATIRSGRASPALIEHIKVDYAGVPTPLNHLAGISAPGARLLVVQPWDQGSIRAIEKAILKSEVGLTPMIDGNILRLNVPPLTEERRQDLIKLVRRRLEERKVIIRNLRHGAMNDLKELEKSKEISQDEHKRALNLLQKLTDGTIAEIDRVGQTKETELKQV